MAGMPDTCNHAVNPSSADSNLPTNCLSVFDHFVGLALKGLMFCSLFHIGSLQTQTHKNI